MTDTQLGLGDFPDTPHEIERKEQCADGSQLALGDFDVAHIATTEAGDRVEQRTLETENDREA